MNGDDFTCHIRGNLQIVLHDDDRLKEHGGKPKAHQLDLANNVRGLTYPTPRCHLFYSFPGQRIFYLPTGFRNSDQR